MVHDKTIKILEESGTKEKEKRGWGNKEKRKTLKRTTENSCRQKKEEEKTLLRLNKIEEKNEKEWLLKVKKDLKRTEAFEKRIKRRQDMRKKKSNSKNKMIDHSLIHANKSGPLYMPGFFYNKVPSLMHNCSLNKMIDHYLMQTCSPIQAQQGSLIDAWLFINPCRGVP